MFNAIFPYIDTTCRRENVYNFIQCEHINTIVMPGTKLMSFAIQARYTVCYSSKATALTKTEGVNADNFLSRVFGVSELVIPSPFKMPSLTVYVMKPVSGLRVGHIENPTVILL